MRKALAIGRKEMRQALRDVRTLVTILLVPLFLLWLYGFALNFDIRNVRLAVEDRDHSVESRAIVSAFLNSGYFDLVQVIDTDAEIVRLLDANRARAVLVIPEGVGRLLQTQRDARVQVVINGDNANTATTVMGYVTQILRGVSLNLLAERRAMPGLAPPVALEPRVWFNPQLESTIFLVPGLIAFIAMLTAVVSTALSIVREKERGTMEQIRMAPISTVSYVIGKTLPYLLLSFLSALMILGAAMVMFDVPMRGSWALLLGTTALFLVGALGQGLLISTVAESQQIAFQMGLLSSFLPTLILSGFVFPIASMPIGIQYVSYVVPARYYLVALRGIVLKGVSLVDLVPQLLALAAFAFVMLSLSALRLSKAAGR